MIWYGTLESWYIVYFQVPVLPELTMMADDMKGFDGMFKDNPNNDEAVKEAYRYAFRSDMQVMFKMFKAVCFYPMPFLCRKFLLIKALLKIGALVHIILTDRGFKRIFANQTN